MSRLKIFGPFIGLLLTAAVILIFYFNESRVSAVLDRLRSFGKAVWNSSDLYEANADLRLQNLSLEAEIFRLKNAEEKESPGFIEAETFSRYPWNDRYSLIVNAGERKGVKKGMPVLAAKNILMGFVKNVKPKLSEITTILSPEWQNVVRLGENGIEAVLIGGHEPRLEFIQKQGLTSNGDRVLNASPEFPLNLFIGEVGELEKSKTGSFEKAKLRITYDWNDLKKVIIVSDHESYEP